MKEFFRGWRRKVGVMTLILACALAAGWIRCLGFRDKLIVNGSRSHLVIWFNNQLVSSETGIAAGVYWNSEDEQPNSKLVEWSSFPNLTPIQVAKQKQTTDDEYRNTPAWEEDGNWEREILGFIFFGARNQSLCFTKPDRRNFFIITRGSIHECVPLLELAARRTLLAQADHEALKEKLEEIARMLGGLINNLDISEA